MHFQSFHGLYDPIDSGGAQDDWNPSGEPPGVIQDEDDLLFIIVGIPSIWNLIMVKLMGSI